MHCFGQDGDNDDGFGHDYHYLPLENCASVSKKCNLSENGHFANDRYDNDPCDDDYNHSWGLIDCQTFFMFI